MTIKAIFDNVGVLCLKLCHIFTNERWSKLEGFTNKYKNIIYHLRESKLEKEINKDAIIGDFSQ